MPRQRILSSDEQTLFDTPPELSAIDRKKYFFVSQALGEVLASFRSPANRVCFLLMLGYFRATHRFYGKRYHPQDMAHVARQLDVPPGSDYMSSYDGETTFYRHRALILEFFGFRPFDRHTRQSVTTHLRPLIRSQIRPKILFRETIDFLDNRKTEIPSSGTLTSLILDAVQRHKNELVRRIRIMLPDESKRALDALFEKAGQTGKTAPAETDTQDGSLNATADESEIQHTQRARLTLLKNFSHSMKPGKIRENLADRQTLCDLYRPLRETIRSLDLTPDGLRYYAHSVIKSEVFQISRRADPERHLHLLCFIAHQYFHLHDLLIDTLLVAAQNTRNTCQREHRDKYYRERADHRRDMRSLVVNVRKAMCHPLEDIRKIVFTERIPDTEKVRRIRDVLRQRGEERASLESRLTGLEESLQPRNDEREYYAVLESRSIKLQNKVAEIVRSLDFQGNDEALMEAIRYYQNRKGDVTRTAPVSFLEEKESRFLTGEDGKFRISLYKALIYAKTADAVKSGALNVEDSYRYRSLDDYLIPQADWKERKDELLEEAGLTKFADCRTLLSKMKKDLDRRYTKTNRNIMKGRNGHIVFHKDGGYHLRTPKQEESEAEPLGSFFSKDRYVSLLEALWTVNRHSRFLDAFRHWQTKYVKKRPPDEVLFAGIIGYGGQVGIGKIARISRQISGSELEQAVNWYFSPGNVAEGNDLVLGLMDRLWLPQACRREWDRLHTSSDGQKRGVDVDCLHARHSFKYFGQEKGVSACTMIDERHFLSHSLIISVADSEAHYVIDLLMHNEVVKSDIHSTDTGGYTEILFGVISLLCISFAPRIKNFGRQKLYSFRRRKEYKKKKYKILPDGYINEGLIEEHWDDILRFVATIKLKVTSASQLFKRLNSYSKQHPLYRALKEFGKIEKSLFMLTWIDNVELRQAVEKQLNKGENANKFADATYFGRNQEFLHAEKSEQEMADGCNRLIRNVIICWNYLYLSQKIAEETDDERRQTIIEAVKHGSIATWGHFNLHGEFDFSPDRLRDATEFDLFKILEADIDIG
jgi:TnpA family transposase